MGTFRGSPFSLGSLLDAPVKHRVFVSYHHGGDQAYYDAFSQAFHDTYEVIQDNSLERAVNSDDAEYVRRRIREGYITNTSCTFVLIGRDTWGRKHVDWEIKATLDKEHGLIGVQLPTAPVFPSNNTVKVPERLADNISSGFALWVSWHQLIASASQIGQLIADAKSRTTLLIRNGREMRMQNASLGLGHTLAGM
jgi:hypothetical protein